VDAEFAKDDRKRSRTAKSCGPDAPMAGVKFARSPRFLGATVTNKLWSRRGEHGISRKPLRREGRSVSAEPVCSCAFFYLPLHMRPRVQRAPGLPCVPLLRVACALLLLRANDLQNSGECCRENAKACLAVIARSEATKQSSFSLAAVDCVAEPVIGPARGRTRWFAMTVSPAPDDVDVTRDPVAEYDGGRAAPSSTPSCCRGCRARRSARRFRSARRPRSPSGSGRS
jgi:hypothetical protein